jgi:predicted permease
MRALRAFLLRLMSPLDNDRNDREMTEEFESHLAMQIEDNLRAGMSPEQARREALLKSGGLETSKESCRDRRGLPLIETVSRDFGYALRQVRRSPGFAAAAVITLALGLTVNATIFFLVNDLFLRPLPATDPGKLVVIVQKIPQMPMLFPASYTDFLDFRRSAEGSSRDFPEMARAFSGIMAYLESAIQLSRPGEGGERTHVHAVSGNYFTVLGAQPMLGRLFLPGEGWTAGADAIIVLTYDTWKNRFAADPHIAGQLVKINGLPFTVVGVTQPKFVGAQWGTALSGFVPISMLPLMNPGGNEVFTNRGYTSVFMMGRLQQGASLAQARAATTLVMARLLKDYPQYHPPVEAAVVLRESMCRPSPLAANFTPLIASALMVMALLVLAITVANVANLLYARTADREREVAIRGALGATRWRLLSQLLAESTLLALAAGALGAMAAIAVVPTLGNLVVPGDMAPPANTGTDWRLFVFTFVASLATGILAGLLPSLKATRLEILPLLKNSPAVAGGRHRLRSLLVIAQVAFSCVVLICAGLAARSVQKLSQINLGFRPDHIFLATVDPSLQRYGNELSRLFHAQLLDKLRALPGVTSASIATHLPFDVGGSQRAGVWPEGQTPTESQKFLSVVCTSVDRAYLETIGTRIVAGRDFTAHDDGAAPRVVIINRALARMLWPNADPVGRRMALQGDAMQVVGVVDEMRVWAIADTNRPLVFYPLAQRFQQSVTIVARTGMDPIGISASVRRAVAELDPDMPIYNIRTLDQQIARSPMGMAPLRFGAAIAGAQGVIALFLATLGLYGLISHSVKRRRHEVGIRMALGATSSSVVNLVLREGLKLAGIGLTLGLLAALGLTRFLRGLLYGVPTFDPVSFSAVAALLIAVGILACWWPAHRAAKVDPVVALRTD